MFFCIHLRTTPAATNRRPTTPSLHLLHHPRIITKQPLRHNNNAEISPIRRRRRHREPQNILPRRRVREKDDEILVSGVIDVIEILRSDYENAYFVTGVFTYSIYDSDCLFEDPTIKFRGTDLYYRNLKLLVPFFDEASIALKEIEGGFNSGKTFVLAKWRLSMSSFRVAVELVLGDMWRHLHLHHDVENEAKIRENPLARDCGVGKGSLLSSLFHNYVSSSYNPTVGAYYESGVMNLLDGTTVRLGVWDTSGHPRSRLLIRPHYQEAMGVLLVYDVT
ncbi:Ras-related protein [Drosera capensis]